VARWHPLMADKFLFSSRRRHTRSTRDWSSDVCSSDLPRCSSSTGRAARSPPRCSSTFWWTTGQKIASTSPSIPARAPFWFGAARSEEHTSELQSRVDLVCRLLLEKKKEEARSTAGYTE